MLFAIFSGYILFFSVVGRGQAVLLSVKKELLPASSVSRQLTLELTSVVLED